MTYEEMCKDERVLYRFVNQKNHIGIPIHREYKPTLTELWKWWCEVNKERDELGALGDFYTMWYDSKEVFESLEYALLSAILEKECAK